MTRLNRGGKLCTPEKCGDSCRARPYITRERINETYFAARVGLVVDNRLLAISVKSSFPLLQTVQRCFVGFQGDSQPQRSRCRAVTLSTILWAQPLAPFSGLEIQHISCCIVIAYTVEVNLDLLQARHGATTTKTSVHFLMVLLSCGQSFKDHRMHRPDDTITAALWDHSRSSLIVAGNRLGVWKNKGAIQSSKHTHEAPVTAALYNSHFHQVGAL